MINATKNNKAFITDSMADHSEATIIFPPTITGTRHLYVSVPIRAHLREQEIAKRSSPGLGFWSYSEWPLCVWGHIHE